MAGEKRAKEIPALKEFHQKISIQEMFALVDTVFENDPALSRDVKVYFCRKYMGERLKDIGEHFAE